jgi:hypothetical protein
MYNVKTDKKICSGDEICLETSDPDRLPLPDWRLLDMQWILQRITAMSGAAERHDDFYEDDNDSCGDLMGDEEDLEMEDEWALSSPSLESTIPSSPPIPSSPLPRKLQFGTAPTTTADKCVVSYVDEATKANAMAEKDIATEEKGTKRADLDVIVEFEEREAKKRMVLRNGKC